MYSGALKGPPALRIHHSGICKISCAYFLLHIQIPIDQVCRGCKIIIARSGGVTHWLLTPDDDGTPMTVCWGQNAANGVSFL